MLFCILKIDNMESTNELVTKAEASADGLSVDSTNERLTKAEFNANLPTPPSSHMTFHWEIKGAL
jgi:hypothetical protein